MAEVDTTVPMSEVEVSSNAETKVEEARKKSQGIEMKPKVKKGSTKIIEPDSFEQEVCRFMRRMDPPHKE